MKICSSIASGTTWEALNAIRSMPPWVDCAEIRTDTMKDPDLVKILRRPRPAMIITNRRRDEGGSFDGPAGVQVKLLEEAIRLGAEYIDIEMSWGKPMVRRLCSMPGKTTVICSHHNFASTPTDLPELYERMRSTGAGVLKIVTTANDISDNRLIFDLLRRAGNDRQKLIALCMGERGQASRILGGCFGNYLTYAYASEAQPTAPGQLSSDQLWSLYRVTERNAKTAIFGLVGNPVKYSRGIYYHNARFAKCSVNGIYVNFLVDKLSSFLEAFLPVVRGFSVTMPYKREISGYVIPGDPGIGDLGAINTVLRLGRRLVGYNTDYVALKQAIRSIRTLRGKRVLILGTGSMARTMVFTSVSQKAKVTIIGRSGDKACDLADEFGCGWSTFDKLPSGHPDVVMNGTSVGMGVSAGARLLPPSFFRRGMLVVEAVHTPVETQLVMDARHAGAKVITGMEIFERQAILQSNFFLEAIR